MCTYLEGNANLTSRIKDVKSWGAQRDVRGLNMSEGFRGRGCGGRIQLREAGNLTEPDEEGVVGDEAGWHEQLVGGI